MAIFPPRLKFPQEHCNASEPIPRIPRRKDIFLSFLQDLNCEGHRFTALVNNQKYLDTRAYYFLAVHLIIPKYFTKVFVEPESGVVLGESDSPIGIEINRWFALSLRDPDVVPAWGVWDNQILFEEGVDNCGLSAHSYIKPPKSKEENGNRNQRENGNKEEDSFVKHYYSNIHQLFFKFHNHYYTPIILSNGQTCYYIFEKKEKIRTWVTQFSQNEEYVLAIDRPIEYSNVLRVPVTRDVKIKCSTSLES